MFLNFFEWSNPKGAFGVQKEIQKKTLILAFEANSALILAFEANSALACQNGLFSHFSSLWIWRRKKITSPFKISPYAQEVAIMMMKSSVDSMLNFICNYEKYEAKNSLKLKYFLSNSSLYTSLSLISIRL